MRLLAWLYFLPMAIYFAICLFCHFKNPQFFNCTKGGFEFALTKQGFTVIIGGVKP